MASSSSSPKPKIRVALIGLNAPYTGTPTGTNWAASAHLPYLQTSSKYELVALQNSSAERARKSIEAYGLNPEKVKAYGNPEDLAADPDIDLVVSSIRVDRHAGSLIPSIKSGKAVFVEWPLEANYAKAKELADLVKAHRVRNVVGLQGGFSPIAKKAKAIIECGDIGRVESSTMVAMNSGGATVSSHVGYFVDRKVGGNMFTIAFGHGMEFITEGGVSSHHSLLVNQYPSVSIVNLSTREVISQSQPNDVPNQIVFNAVMDSGAVFTYKLHNSATISPGAKPRQNGGGRMPALDWRIFGSRGELRITSYSTWSLNVGAEDVRLEIWKADQGEVVEVDVGADEFEDLPLRARNIAKVYEAFAAGIDGEGKKREWYPDFEYGLKRHELIETMYRENGF
ncbi:MAG: hypothetical protein M1834_009493 [Cirrosporium novae-zelandiae]|nr:MAG: hypothetical protein M1834_009493 [Cirrosporium novae-zelandiae]